MKRVFSVYGINKAPDMSARSHNLIRTYTVRLHLFDAIEYIGGHKSFYMDAQAAAGRQSSHICQGYSL